MSLLPSSVQHVVCYLRKSREDEEAERRGEDTLAKQRVLMKQDVLSRYNFTYDLAEEVASGDSIRVRPVFQSLLPKLGNDYQAIVCKDLSRLGRGSYSDMGIVYDIIRDRRVFVITKDAVYDPANFSDLRMIRFSLFFNREEYEMTVWRLTEGKYDGAAKGKWVAGSVPYGFRYNSRTQNLEPSDSAAAVVRLIYNLYLQGHGYRAISKQLSKLGIRSPRGKKNWHPEVLRRIISNPAYTGKLVFRRTKRNKLDGRVTVRPPSEHIVVEDAFPGLVSKEIWQSAQDKAQTTAREAISQENRKGNVHVSELSGLVRCRHCGHPLVRQHSVQQYKRKTGKLSYYEKEFLYCPYCGYAVKYRSCETQLLNVLNQIPFDKTLWNTHLHRVAVDDISQTPSHSADIRSESIYERLLERRKSLETRRIRARELVLDGTFSKEDFQQITKQIDEELHQLDAGLYTVSPSIPQRSSYPDRSNRNGKMDSNHSCGTIHQELESNKNQDIIDNDVQNLRDTAAEVSSLAHFYGILRNRSSRNRLLRLVFDSIDLELVERGRGRNHPGLFNLYVTLQPHWLETL